MERTENIGFGELKLIQDTDEFCYGIDAVILADFAYSICSDFDFAIDLGCGNGIIPFILSHKNREANFLGIELQERSVDLAERSCKLNSLENRIRFLLGNVAEPGIFDKAAAQMDAAFEKANVVTCNPPYFSKGGGIPSRNKGKYIARHETEALIEDFIAAAAGALKERGHFFMVHRPSRLVDIFFFCRKSGLEPKTIRYVVPRAGEIPNIVLIHCVLGGGKELKMMKDLCVYGENGVYSDEILKIYERE